MPRLFTAIALDQQVRDRITAEQQRLMRDMQGASVRWVQSEHMHLTLVFIGQVADDVATAIVTTMQSPIPLGPFTIEFADLGVFPPRGAPRVLWIGVARGSEQMVRVHRHVSDRLRQAGVATEERPFSPHLTIGRWRGRGGRPSEKPRAARRPEKIATANVRAVTLFLSRPTSAGPSYSVLAEAPLVEAAGVLH